MKKTFCGISTVSFVLFFLFSCGSAPKSSEVNSIGHIESSYIDKAESVPLPIPPKKDRSFFSSIPAAAMLALENGSPESLRFAYSSVRKEINSYSEVDKVFFNVIKAISQIVWPSELFFFDCPEADSANSYIGAIESARHGIYDMSTGNSDFLNLVLPSLVLLTSTSRDDYYDISKTSLEAALKLNENSVLVNYLLGVLLRRQKIYDQSLMFFKKAYEFAPDCLETSYAYAYGEFLSGNISVALELGEKIIYKNPQYMPVLKFCAEAAFTLGDLNKAELYVARVLQQEPDNSYYVLFRAKILVQKGDYIRAASLLDVFARTDTENRDYLFLRAKVQKDWNRNITAALSTIEKAITLYPDDIGIILAAAQIAFETRSSVNGKSANELAAIVLSKDSSNVAALEIQINDLIQSKKWDIAYKSSSDLIKLNDSSNSALFTHISVCLAVGKKEEAWKIVSGLYEKNPNNDEVIQAYIKVLISIGKKDEALNLITQQLPSASSKMKSFFYYEKSFLVSSEDDILVNLRSSLTANPRNKDALFRLYQIYFAKKEYKKAQYYLKQVVALSPADNSLLKLNTELETLLSK